MKFIQEPNKKSVDFWRCSIERFGFFPDHPIPRNRNLHSCRVFTSRVSFWLLQRYEVISLFCAHNFRFVSNLFASSISQSRQISILNTPIDKHFYIADANFRCFFLPLIRLLLICSCSWLDRSTSNLWLLKHY